MEEAEHTFLSFHANIWILTELYDKRFSSKWNKRELFDIFVTDVNYSEE